MEPFQKLLGLYNKYIVVIYEALFFDVAQGQMNGAPNETSTLLLEEITSKGTRVSYVDYQ